MTDKVRNEWILVLLICSISLRCLEEGVYGLCSGLFHMVLVLLLLLPVFAFRALGAADIKIFLSLSIYFPLKSICFLFCSSVVAGALIGIFSLLFYKITGSGQRLRYTQNSNSHDSVKQNPFHYIHFTIPIFISVLLYQYGGVYELLICHM